MKQKVTQQEQAVFQKIGRKPKMRVHRQPEWERIRVKHRQRKQTMQEYHMNTHGR